MYLLSVDSNFSAAHYLRDYPGECARLHGHTWGVTASVKVNDIGEMGMTVDFKAISAALNEAVKKFDHQTLNDLKEFEKANPTAENIARSLFNVLENKITGLGAVLDSVTVEESAKCRVTYFK